MPEQAADPISLASGQAADTDNPDLLVCLAAVARALEGEFDPRRFLDDLSRALQPLVPHDRLGILYLDEDRRTYSVFAEHAAPGLLPRVERYTTDAEREVRFPVADSPLRPVFEGVSLCVPDLPADARFAGHARQLRPAELRSAVFVPLLAGSRSIGALAAVSRVPGIHEPAHLERLRAVGRLIGPFIETIVLLYRERRRRRRLGLLYGITQALGTSLEVRDNLIPLTDAIRPALDFDRMGVALLTPGTREVVLFASVGADVKVSPERLFLHDLSCAPALESGSAVLIHDAPAELNPDYASDRIVIAAGAKSCVVVPMLFGDEFGGALFFAKEQPHWYDRVDAEVATAVASHVVLGIQHQRLAEERRRLASVERRLQSVRSELQHRYGFDQITGRSPLLREVLAHAAQVAGTETTVLITGESGTGKELVARAVHHASARADGPFIAVNCAALPDTLLESELFGHERGAFTGADRQKPGRFELAAGGTLFLDEVGDLSAAVQAKLLRVLQEREFQRVGGTATLRADVRVIAATNRDLSQEVEAGRFRSDLFYRLNVFALHLPPLRDRGNDVLMLADHFVRTLGAQMGKGDLTLSRDAREVLLHHAWPGNIRELQNAIERSLIISEGTLITAAHLAIAPRAASPGPPPQPAVASPEASVPHGSLSDLERTAILEALRRANGNKSKAAASLGVTRFQLYTRLKRYQIGSPQG